MSIAKTNTNDHTRIIDDAALAEISGAGFFSDLSTAFNYVTSPVATGSEAIYQAAGGTNPYVGDAVEIVADAASHG